LTLTLIDKTYIDLEDIAQKVNDLVF